MKAVMFTFSVFGEIKCTFQANYFHKYKSKNLHIVRLHIGLEDPKDLISDLKKSLRYIK